MSGSTESRSEKYLAFSRRSMSVLLLLVVAVGAVCVAMAFRPSPAWPSAIVPLTFIMAVIAIGLQRTLGGERWDPRKPEVRAIVEDEWRRSNMDRARRAAFAAVLVVQLPLGLVLSGLPSLQALMAMAAATITLGLATLLGLFLYFDRDTADAG